MGWIYLIAAIVLEVAGTTCMKLSEGLSHVWPSIFIFIFYGLCLFVFVPLCLKSIEIGIAYAIWSGLGTILVTLIGIFAMHESITLLQIIALISITFGILGLKISNPSLSEEEILK